VPQHAQPVLPVAPTRTAPAAPPIDHHAAVREPGHLRILDEWERAEGAPAPQGVTWVDALESWNFALYSRRAASVTLLLYAPHDLVTPVLTLPLDPLVNKSGRIWHAMVPAAEAPGARYYAYRVEGPDAPRNHFVPTKVLSDPYARRLHFPPGFSRAAACGDAPNDGQAPLGVLPTGADTHWEAPPSAGPRHAHEAVVYEVHVRGFTARANSGVAPERRGTFRGLIDKIPYLQELGVTVVELLPVHQFDPQEGNYWGYMTLNFFAPHAHYAQDDPVREFRELVDALHAAGIELWLDVVYNHTAEGDGRGPIYNLKGIDNDAYYIVGEDGSYWNDTGTGNTVQGADVASRGLILASLAHWVRLGVDGFRFDLASILTRDADGHVSADAPPLVSEIGVLAARGDVRLVAEAWDLGAYLLGRAFPGLMWRQWNGRFRDDVRAFVKGDEGLVPALMRRVYGSDDLFPDGPGDMYRPAQSVNFVTAHDGFCLYDLVSYDERHNEANGHGGTDGASDNRSWNCGWEGDEGAPADVLALRMQQMKNFIALLMLSNGTPMLVAGDEFANTQRGNNNPYNQDNELTWLDWDRLDSHRDLFAFTKGMIALRKARRSIARSRYWREDVRWFGTSGAPDEGPWSHSVAWWLSGQRYGEGDLYVLVNAYWEPLDFDIQVPGIWRRIVDTALPSASGMRDVGQAPLVGDEPVTVAPRSIVVLST
jgi:glycogen operon protein